MTSFVYMGVNPKIGENHQIINFNRVFPIHFGGNYPYFWKHPYLGYEDPSLDASGIFSDALRLWK